MFKAPVYWAPPGEQGQPSETETREVVNFTTFLPVFVDPGLESELIERKVDIRAPPLQTGNRFLSLLLWSFGPAILIVGLYVWLFRRAAKQGGGMFGGRGGLGKSKARRFDKETRSEERGVGRGWYGTGRARGV